MRRVVLTLCAAGLLGSTLSGAAGASGRLTPVSEFAVRDGAITGGGDQVGMARPSLFGTGVFAQRVIEDDERDRRKREEMAEPRKPLRPRNPWVAMALGAAVPGAGHFYVKGPNLTSFVYAGAEVVEWLLHFTWDSDGHDKEDEFRDYAWRGDLRSTPGDEYDWTPDPDEGHWSWDRWRETRGTECQVGAGMTWDEADSLLVHFWQHNRREFYEDIGKYDRYNCGWLQPEFRTTYVSIRDEANDLLSRARTMTQLVLLNHLASGIHAFFVAKSHNRQVVPGTEIDWDLRPEGDGGYKAQLVLRKRF